MSHFFIDSRSCFKTRSLFGFPFVSTFKRSWPGPWDAAIYNQPLLTITNIAKLSNAYNQRPYTIYEPLMPPITQLIAENRACHQLPSTTRARFNRASPIPASLLPFFLPFPALTLTALFIFPSLDPPPLFLPTLSLFFLFSGSPPHLFFLHPPTFLLYTFLLLLFSLIFAPFLFSRPPPSLDLLCAV